MSPSQNLVALTEFPRFRDLPPELRVIIWRLISLPDPIDKVASRYQAVNIFPQCEGRKSHFSYTRNPTSLERQLSKVRQGIKITKTPLPVTTKINRESRAETFRYWVIELNPKRGLAPLCFLQTHHRIKVNSCCFIEPRRRKQGKHWDTMDANQQLDATSFGTWEFRRWIQNPKKEHPGQIEKIHKLYTVKGHSTWGPVASQLQTCLLTHFARQPGGKSSKLNNRKRTWNLFDNILEFPRLTDLILYNESGNGSRR